MRIVPATVQEKWFKTTVRRLLWRLKPDLFHALVPDNGQVFSIGIYFGDNPFSLTDSDQVKNPVLTTGDITDVPAGLVADPFMLLRDHKWFMFFEVYNKVFRKGEIGLAISEDGIAWRYDRIVLRLPSHLSYPYVFQTDNEVYMIPENLVNGVFLYKAQKFPYEWQLQKKLIPGEGYVDSSIFHWGDLWWLFTAKSPSPGTPQCLYLFFSEVIAGEWREHPQSPVVCTSSCCGRPAGKVLQWDNKLIRLGQECETDYGTAVHAFEILELTPTRYFEREIDANPVLCAGPIQWHSGGMHHMDAHRTPSGRWMACVDGWYGQAVKRSILHPQGTVKPMTSGTSINGSH